MGGTAPGGIADGYWVGGGDAVGVANSGLPHEIQWGAFASFMAIVFGVSLMSFLYARDLLAYYGIGIFLGFVSNMVVRVAGTATGGKLGEGLLEISALERKG